MSEPTPSAWAMEQALLLDIYCDCGCRARTTCSESMGFIAAALDAAKLRGHTRTVNEMASRDRDEMAKGARDDRP